MIYLKHKNQDNAIIVDRIIDGRYYNYPYSGSYLCYPKDYSICSKDEYISINKRMIPVYIKGDLVQLQELLISFKDDFLYVLKNILNNTITYIRFYIRQNMEKDLRSEHQKIFDNNGYPACYRPCPPFYDICNNMHDCEKCTKCFNDNNFTDSIE
jgi:hypothetical protein